MDVIGQTYPKICPHTPQFTGITSNGEHQEYQGKSDCIARAGERTSRKKA